MFISRYSILLHRNKTTLALLVKNVPSSYNNAFFLLHDFVLNARDHSFQSIVIIVIQTGAASGKELMKISSIEVYT